jgi:hypothetical protein
VLALRLRAASRRFSTHRSKTIRRRWNTPCSRSRRRRTSRFASTNTTGTRSPSRPAPPASRRSGIRISYSSRSRASSRRRIVASRLAVPFACARETCWSTATEGRAAPNMTPSLRRSSALLARASRPISRRVRSALARDSV